MASFITSTSIFTDTDIKTIKRCLIKRRLTLFKIIILFVCLSFIIPFLPGIIDWAYPRGILSSYWAIYAFTATCFLFGIIILVIGNNSMEKEIKVDLANNIKNPLTIPVRIEEFKTIEEELIIYVLNLDMNKGDTEKIKNLFTNVKDHEIIVIEYTTESKILLSLNKT